MLEVWRSTADAGDFLETLPRLASGGNAHVMYELGRIYAGGKGVPRDDTLAMQWFRQGTKGGSARAMTALAIALMDGRGKASDPLEPLRLLQTATASNDTEAMFRLAIFSWRAGSSRRTRARQWHCLPRRPKPGTLLRCSSWDGCTTVASACRLISARR